MALPDLIRIPVQDDVLWIYTSHNYCLSYTYGGTATLFNNASKVIWREIETEPNTQYRLMYDGTIVRKITNGSCSLIRNYSDYIGELLSIDVHLHLSCVIGDILQFSSLSQGFYYYNVKTSWFITSVDPFYSLMGCKIPQIDTSQIDRYSSDRYSSDRYLLKSSGYLDYELWLNPFKPDLLQNYGKKIEMDMPQELKYSTVVTLTKNIKSKASATMVCSLNSDRKKVAQCIKIEHRILYKID
jgi:hypothetical protein